MQDTVKQLTEKKRKDEATKKQSKNSGIGMKNKKLRGEIHKILGEMASNSGSASLGANGINPSGKQTHSDDSARHSDNRVTNNRFTNLPLAETIRKLQAGSEGGTGVYKVETIVGHPNCDSESPGACGGGCGSTLETQ